MQSIANYKRNHHRKIKQYIDGVLSGKIIANQWIVGAVKQSKEWLSPNSKYYLNKPEFDRFLTFIYYTNIKIKGRYQRTELQPFQMWLVAIGRFLYVKKTKLPKHEEVTFFVSRKNAKTTLMSLLGLYDLINDDEPEVYSLASSQDQAGICLRTAQKIVEKSPKLRQRFNVTLSQIKNPSNFGVFKSLIGNETKLDGPEPSLAIVDEAGAVKDYVSLKGAMTSGQVAKPGAQTWTISTANVSLTNGFYEHIQLGKKVALGEVDLPEQFFAIYALDDYEQEWNNPDAWKKVCPMIDISIPQARYANQLKLAQYRTSEKINFTIKNLNEFVSGASQFLPDSVYIKNAVSSTFIEGALSYVGVDLSATRDLSAISLLQVDEEGNYNFERKIYMPNNDEKLNRRDGIDLRPWIKDGHIIQMGMERIDYEMVAADIAEWCSKYMVSTVNIDPWNSTQLKTYLAKHGIFYQDAKQTIQYMNTPIKLLEVAFHDGRVRTGQNPAVRWMYNNVELISDATGSVKFTKKNKTEAVDVCIADVNAIYGWYKENLNETSFLRKEA